MKITILALGSRGDVQPYVALGTGLRAAGHAVRVITTLDFASLVTSYGLEAVAIETRVEDMGQQQMQGLIESGNVLKILARTGQGAQQLAEQTASAGLAAAQDADLLLGGLGSEFTGRALAEKLRIPFIPAYLVPLSATRHFPSILLPTPAPRLPAWANGLSHRLTQQMMWQMFRGADAKARTGVLGLPPAPFWGPERAPGQAALPILYGYSPRVVPRPPDWAAHIHVTGYWLLPPPAAWEPPPELVQFLQAGPPPVYVGFGSMFSSNPEATAALMVAALAQSGQRGVIYGGWSGVTTANFPDTVFLAGSLPHSWLFPQMAAVVHHGGAGTTAAALYAGMPAIVTPFFGDQPFWGQRIAALGVGPDPIPRRQLTAEKLAAAIRKVVADQGMRERAAVLGARIRAENGIARAVSIVEQAIPAN